MFDEDTSILQNSKHVTWILGPLTKANTNVIVGLVQSGKPCTSAGLRVGIYIDVLKTKVHNFIKSIVPDVEIEGGN